MMRAPEQVRRTTAAHLRESRCTAEHGRALLVRIDRFWDDLLQPLERLYPDGDPGAVAADLVERATRAYLERTDDLHLLDYKRALTPDWLQQPGQVGYACYADRFAGTLMGLTEKVDYLSELGVTYLHLMPALKPRDGDNDGGYAIADYRTIRPDLGTTDDLRHLATTLRGHGISLVMDLVLNHVAREHEWAERARSGEQRYRDYFHIFPDRTVPDAYERTLPEVFPDFAPGNFTWDEDLQGWVWTTFNEWQWDVNWANPDVLTEYVDIILFLANLGVEVLRLDAIAFTWKRMGTTCQNEPEVHDLTQVLRTVARIAASAVVFKAEAIVGPRDLVPYLGVGRHVGRVSDLAYHNSLMVQIWSMLASQETFLARHALTSLPATPPLGTWITYVRCHDDIGWAIDDRDAGEVGVSGFEHRRFLARWYDGSFPGSWADGMLFQVNEQTGDMRTSGTTASLLGMGGATGERLDTALSRYVLAHAMIYGWGGLPVIWSGDELATPNDPNWADEPGHEDDNRWAHRPRLDWTAAERRHDRRTVEGRAFAALSHLAHVRTSLPQLHAQAPSRVVRDTDNGILAAIREHPSGPMVTVYNVTESWRPFAYAVVAGMGIGSPWNALGDHGIAPGEDGLVWLPPLSAWWIVDRPDGQGVVG
ncbi:alpha-amylase family protein [Nostocoides sp. F2B08]|uniref:alpha-amylase family protein n=1 Tax=Nostocoides sp. F2B08 TaxID=2653936 RepID=UPI001D055B39|nr:alpha-amylase family protein [Tetrasphaera sp. F2B08]